MKLYATITSERATKGQGGNKQLEIEIMGENKEVIARLRVRKPLSYEYKEANTYEYEVNLFPVMYPNRLKIDVKGYGYNLKRKLSEAEKLEKGKQQKGEEKCDCVECTNSRGETDIPF